MDREPPDEAELPNQASAELDTQRRQEEEETRQEVKKAGEVHDRENSTLQMSNLRVTALSKCP